MTSFLSGSAVSRVGIWILEDMSPMLLLIKCRQIKRTRVKATIAKTPLPAQVNSV